MKEIMIQDGEEMFKDGYSTVKAREAIETRGNYRKERYFVCTKGKYKQHKDGWNECFVGRQREHVDYSERT